jgi:hypothetical protein
MVLDIGEEGVHHSVQIDLGFYSKDSSSHEQLIERKSKFQSELTQIRRETSDDLVSCYKNILDGYFISLSGRAMLKKISKHLIFRVISRNRQG